MKIKRGLSLIVLVITIMVMIVLSGTVIVSLQNDNVINNAKNVVDKTDLATYRQELGVSLMRAFKENPDFKKETFNTSDFDIMKKYIPSMKLVHKGMLEIVKGQLVKIGTVKPEDNNENNTEDDVIIVGDVNMPELLDGMTPIKYESGRWVDVNLKARSNDWFDYKDRRWANARTKDGSYWVWIPRFAYSIKEYKKNKPGLEGKKGSIIEVEFLKGIENNNYPKSYKLSSAVIDKKTPKIVHPAFEFNGKPIKGFWVAKYKASQKENTIKYVEAKNYYTNIKIGKAFSDAYNYAINQNITADSHLMKNIEWGAVAYLASSKFGFIPKQNESTTGNETGVYGMNSICGEFVSACMDNNNINIALNGNETKKSKEQIEQEQENLEEQQEHLEDEQKKETLEAAKKVKEEEKRRLENIRNDLKNKIENEENEREKQKLKKELNKIRESINKIEKELEQIKEELEDVNEDLEEYDSQINVFKLNRVISKIDSFYGCKVKEEFNKYWNIYDVSKLEREDIEEKEANNVQRKSLIDKVYNNMASRQGDALYEIINTYSYLGQNSIWIINPTDTKKNRGKSIYNGDDILLGNFSRIFAVRGSGAGARDSGTGIFSVRFTSGQPEKNVSFRTVLIGK